MIKTIDIRNFRAFKSLRIEECRRINVIVGDNGAGKTALLEALFLALCGGTDIAARLRQQRGLEGNFSGPIGAIEDAIFAGYFHARDTQKPIRIQLLGTGPEARSLQIARGGTSDVVLPFGQAPGATLGASSPFTFTWRDHKNAERSAVAQVTQQGVQFGGTGEDLPDFFFFPSNQTTSAVENATRFSDLSRARRERKFVEAFTKEHRWIEDLSIEVQGGAPAIHATLRDFPQKLPLTDVSGGINRMVGVMLAIASRPRSVTIVDEIENGIYFKHHAAVWRSLLSLVRDHDAQLFTSTHNEEWLEALVEAAGTQIDDIALWRIERGNDGPVVRLFSGKAFKAGIETGGEVR